MPSLSETILKVFILSQPLVYYACVLSCFWFFAALWTVAHQAPLSVGFSRHEYWSGLSFPHPGTLPNYYTYY